MESSKTVDPFVETPAGFSRNPPHCALIGSVGYSAGRIPAPTPVQFGASWKTPQSCEVAPVSGSTRRGPDPILQAGIRIRPRTAGLELGTKIPARVFYFLGGLGGRGSGGGHFPARNPSRCRGEEAERKHKSVSPGPSKLAPVFAERSGSSASATNGS